MQGKATSPRAKRYSNSKKNVFFGGLEIIEQKKWRKTAWTDPTPATLVSEGWGENAALRPRKFGPENAGACEACWLGEGPQWRKNGRVFRLWANRIFRHAPAVASHFIVCCSLCVSLSIVLSCNLCGVFAVLALFSFFALFVLRLNVSGV